MDQSNILKDYKLSQYTIEKLKIIKEKLKDDILNSDPSWKIVTGKKTKEEEEEEEEEKEEEEEVVYLSEEEISNERNSDGNDNVSKMLDQFPSTQFYFTQLNKNLNNLNSLFDRESKHEHVQKVDITECLLEGLEHPNRKLDLSQLENLTDEEFIEVVCDLEKKLSVLGTYNLYCAMNNMTLEQRIKYAAIFHSYLLLPKIIALEEPSRLLLSVITECVKKFPDEVQRLIFVPLLNVNLKDTTIVNAIINAFEPHRNITLVMEYLSHVKELKAWHLSLLHNLLSVKTDITINDKLIQLFSEKAFDFAKDKNFGKLILSFIKVNTNFSKQQKHLLGEIANMHQTMFKKPIQNILISM